VRVLEERGLIESVMNEELRAACTKQRLKVYCGFDPTAESLYLGNLLGIIVLSWFQRCGPVPVALLGGTTARVGDSSRKNKERPMLDEETIARNSNEIGEILTRILEVHSDADSRAVVLNNYD
jgi:tyrosyl-tRNA synthetase